MRTIHRFISQHVTPADRMAEMIFGLIMALGVTGAIRLGAEGLSNRELFVSVTGCNLAWGIVDGVVLVLMRLFERGRLCRVVAEARASKNDAEGFAAVEREMAPEVVELMTADERARLKEIALALLKRADPKPARMEKGDFLHGIAAGLLVLLPTIPVVVPYLVFSDPITAVRTSYAVALVLLFLIGRRWGQLVGGRPWRIGGSLVLLGIALVVVTIALGG